MQLISKYFYKI